MMVPKEEASTPATSRPEVDSEANPEIPVSSSPPPPPPLSPEEQAKALLAQLQARKIEVRAPNVAFMGRRGPDLA